MLPLQAAHRALKGESLDDDDVVVTIAIEDPHADEMPSIKFDFWIILMFCLCILFVGGILAIGILCVSRTQEQVKARNESKLDTNRSAVLKSNLECRRYSQWGEEKTAAMSDRSSLQTYDSPTEQMESFGSSDDNSSHDEDRKRCDLECGNGNVSTCKICDEAFEHGQPVYQSNNPSCRHEFHKHCMDRWLSLQNTCPICNEHYVLHAV